MKSYIIYLPQFETSTAWATHALATGLEHAWNVELFVGVDGRTVADNADWIRWDIGINRANAKCRDMMARPGVRGCFLSHYTLWKRCVELNQPIGIFEHDIEFLKPFSNKEFDHVLKLEGFNLKKSRPAGEWYEGARAYILKPAGAQRLIDWVQSNGAIPADVCIGLNVVSIDLEDSGLVQIATEQQNKWGKHKQSFTWNLDQMV
jgi:GR25 family glycosyltransferase involved in LPS biosynthesis